EHRLGGRVPEGRHHADVGQRVPEGDQLPVEDGANRSVVAGDGIAEPVVAVDDAAGAVRRHQAQQPVAGLLEQLDDARAVPEGQVVDHAAPTPELPLQVAGAGAEVAEAHGVRVDGVEG